MASGLLLNAYLAIIARNLSPAEYGYFGAFWSLTLVAGFGFFLPIEQETARLLQTPGRPLGVVRAVLATAATMVVAQIAVLAISWPVLMRTFGGHSVTVVAFGVICLASGAQFIVRGALIGMDRMGRHALIMVVDAALRVAFATLVALVVAEPNSPEFAWTLAAALLLAHVPQLLALLPRRNRIGSLPAPGSTNLTARDIGSAVVPLLLGSLCAQALLNGPPVLVPALAQTDADATRAGQFVAAYTLTRVPLFLVVPLQTALLPLLTGLLHDGDRRALRRVIGKITAGLLTLAA
ncbi:MAG: polysaccharide biosynthesis protein, partial [Pseudonocardia sp.]|uniref:hypothetical protein n=1 Tax=Pseudonocardia sp. TaxID=60912 RepID=UPI002638ADFB